MALNLHSYPFEALKSFFLILCVKEIALPRIMGPERRMSVFYETTSMSSHRCLDVQLSSRFFSFHWGEFSLKAVMYSDFNQ